MSSADLELRVERLETALAELTARVAQVVPSPPRGGGEGARRADEGVEFPASEEPLIRRSAPPSPLDEGRRPYPADAATSNSSDSPDWLSLAGFSVLIFGGAYLLRAFTESGVLPPLGGVIAGAVYALIWIWIADRKHAVYLAATAAAIAFPLVWETTARFHYVSPATGGFLAAIIGLILIFVAWHNGKEAIAWIASIGSIAVTIAIVQPDAMLPLMIAGSVVGAATLHVAILMRWKFVALPAAVMTNALAAMTIGIPILHGGFDRPGETIAALIGFASVWLTTICYRRIHYNEHLSFFDIIESALLLFIGIGGAAFVAMLSHRYNFVVATIYTIAGVAAYLEASRKDGMRTWLTSVALYVISLAMLLGLELRAVAITAAVLGVASAELGRRLQWPALAAQSVIWIVGAALLGGFFGPAAMAITACALIACLRVHVPIANAMLLGVFVFSLFLIAGHERGALVRTILLAGFATALAFAKKLTHARLILVAGGLKLLAEDVRTERAAILVISFAAYGLAMLAVARCARRHTSSTPQSQGTPPVDTLSSSA